MAACADQILTNSHTSPHLPGVLPWLLDTFQQWRERTHGRRELAKVSERDLHDMGMTRLDAYQELAKPFWRG
jgi:uncharacterized protein YjiS (DUF1127 family)